MSTKKYYVTIYGRTNTRWIGIRGKKLYSEMIISNNKNNAKAEALSDFYMFMSDMWKGILDRRDMKVECEYISWLVDDDRETIYINKIME